MPPSLSQSNAERNRSDKPTVQKENPSYNDRGYSALAFVITYTVFPIFLLGSYVVLVPNFPRNISIPKLLAHPDVYVQYDRK
jgi:hypothetical protein